MRRIRFDSRYMTIDINTPRIRRGDILMLTCNCHKNSRAKVVHNYDDKQLSVEILDGPDAGKFITIGDEFDPENIEVPNVIL